MRNLKRRCSMGNGTQSWVFFSVFSTSDLFWTPCKCRMTDYQYYRKSFSFLFYCKFYDWNINIMNFNRTYVRARVMILSFVTWPNIWSYYYFRALQKLLFKFTLFIENCLKSLFGLLCSIFKKWFHDTVTYQFELPTISNCTCLL